MLSFGLSGNSLARFIPTILDDVFTATRAAFVRHGYLNHAADYGSSLTFSHHPILLFSLNGAQWEAYHITALHVSRDDPERVDSVPEIGLSAPTKARRRSHDDEYLGRCRSSKTIHLPLTPQTSTEPGILTEGHSSFFIIRWPDSPGEDRFLFRQFSVSPKQVCYTVYVERQA
jgi:hypothetical protein